jgi:hypothetical protein
MGQGTRAAALVVDAGTTAGVRGRAGPAIHFPASVVDGPTGSTKLRARLGDATTLVHDAAAPARVGLDTITAVRGLAAAIRRVAARSPELGTRLGHAFARTAEVRSAATANLAPAAGAAVQRAMAAVRQGAAIHTQLSASLGRASAGIQIFAFPTHFGRHATAAIHRQGATVGSPSALCVDLNAALWRALVRAADVRPAATARLALRAVAAFDLAAAAVRGRPAVGFQVRAGLRHALPWSALGRIRLGIWSCFRRICRSIGAALDGPSLRRQCVRGALLASATHDADHRRQDPEQQRGPEARRGIFWARKRKHARSIGGRPPSLKAIHATAGRGAKSAPLPSRGPFGPKLTVVGVGQRDEERRQACLFQLSSAVLPS